MLRRTIGFSLSVILVFWAGYQLAWHKDLRDKLFDHPIQSIGLLAVVVAAIAVFVHASYRPHHGSALLGAALGISAVVWGSSLFDGIKWNTLGLFLMTLVGVFVLWAFTVLDRIPGLPAINIARRAPAVP